jgi:TusA-related sulfurtransferase
MLRARACIKCKEFLLIYTDNPKNLQEIKEFEKEHSGHTIITVNYSEIKGEYNKYEKKENPE